MTKKFDSAKSASKLICVWTIQRDSGRLECRWISDPAASSREQPQGLAVAA